MAAPFCLHLVVYCNCQWQIQHCMGGIQPYKKNNWLACNKANWLQGTAFSFWLLLHCCSGQHCWQVLGLEFVGCPRLWYLPNSLALGKPSRGLHSQWVGGSHSRPLGNPLWGLAPPHHHPLGQGTWMPWVLFCFGFGPEAEWLAAW